MGQKKLIRFEAIKSFPNVLQYPADMQGKWARFFGNLHPLTLELACGKGEYAVGLARMFPQRNFMGIDLKGNRIYIGAKKSLEDGLKNVAFLRSQIDKLANYFEKGEVSEIWITFPDPQLRKSKAKKRLTHPKFLRLYQQILVPGGTIHLKTDSPDLYEFTLLVIEMYGLTLLESSDHVYEEASIKEELKIKTHYESLDIAQSNKVHYIRFTLPNKPLADFDEQLQERIKSYEEEVN
jgi:tRNA (guanine-N7-)-methyltransferase